MSLLTQSLHPGEVLAELYLDPLEMSPVSLAEKLDISHQLVQKVIKGKGDISADIAIRLGRLFSTTPEFWMNLQRNWDLSCARESTDVVSIKPIKKVRAVKSSRRSRAAAMQVQAARHARA